MNLASMLFKNLMKKIPVALTIATAKSTNSPDLVVTHVVLYRLEKEGGQHKEAD